METPYTREPIKIKTYECFTKFQQAHPAHRSNLINKQLGYDCIIEPEGDSDSVKIKNCINSSRPNSQLFKRLAKPLVNNIKNDIDQLLFFTSLDPVSRIETSIGLPTNPGLFLIIGLTYLDQKYKQSYQRCDIEFSFMQFRDSQMFDLLCYTGEPLHPRRLGANGEIISFREHWIRVSTFNQFIKLFKVALFNNKQRDFTSSIPENKYRSTFIMKIRNKVYSEQGQLLRCQETTLVDYEANCQKQCSNIKEKAGTKTLLDYILIDMHNANPALKDVHYHMVEQNHLLMMINQFLKRPGSQKDCPVVGGQVVFLNCIPADQATFPACHQYLTHITSTIGDSWQARVAPKPKQSKKLNLNYIECQLRCIVNGVSVNTYSSLRNFHTFKQQLIVELKRCKIMLKELRKAVTASLKQKIQLTFMKNEFLAYQIKLIGSCIKSDHFKDFYNAKSYIQLQRQVSIKTQGIKEEIKIKSKVLKQVEKKYAHIKKRQMELIQKNQSQKSTKNKIPEQMMENTTNWSNYISLQMTKQNWNKPNEGNNKFKRISLKPQLSQLKGEQNQLNELKRLISYLNEHMFNLWDNYSLFQERTVANSIQFEQNLLRQEQMIGEAISQFVTQIDAINQTEIMYEQENNVYNNNQVGLFRSLNFLGLLGPKKKVNNYEIGKRLVINAPQKKNKSNINRNPSIDYTKFPSICVKTPQIVISGNSKISQLLTNPNKESKNGSFRQ